VFFNTKTVQQVAALPFVVLGARIEVLLVTSRHGGRWLLPKGWPDGKEPFAAAAAREALEEAGVVGTVQGESIGAYTYTKSMPAGYQVRSHVFVYPLCIHEHRLDWPERDERNCRWAELGEASGLVGDRGLARLLRNLSRSANGVLLNTWAGFRPDLPTQHEQTPNG
jgi:8-oxo-dGTP pyrophosphatase MutT (NUDIX family)